jgi:hypothetical protein
MRPLILELRQRAEHIRQQEVERTLRYLDPIAPDTREQIQYLTRALVSLAGSLPVLPHPEDAEVRGESSRSEPC